MNKENRTINFDRCPVCASAAIVPYKKGSLQLFDLDPERVRITDAEYGLTWDLSYCLACHFVFANPCPHPSWLVSVYSQLKDPAYESEAEGRSQSFRRILWRLEKITSGRNLLDVGAATGMLLAEARLSGWRVAGVEPSQWAVEAARRKYGLEIYQGSFEDFETNGTLYDAVTLIDVLEHTPNPRNMMEKTRLTLKPDGIAVLVTPDLNSLMARLAGKRWWHFRPSHLGYFTRESLQKLLDLTGFFPLLWKRYSWNFSLNYILARLPYFSVLTTIPRLASLWSIIRIKLTLGDSFEVYARKRANL